MARAAVNLLLLGDPQQLPQVSQGTHPEPVDASALGWLVEGHRTLPEQRGYFLDRSYRMHPAVCEPVSRLSYEGRLHSDEQRTAARHLDGHPPGVRVLTVDHDGNSTAAPRRRPPSWPRSEDCSDPTGPTKTAPGHWVRRTCLSSLPTTRRCWSCASTSMPPGWATSPVGTVDKFQGRQAPVVFVSMTASSIDDVPRGISFLLNRNRLNVAVSRAKYASVIVRSTMLTEYLPSTPAGLVDLGAFLSLSPCDTPSQ